MGVDLNKAVSKGLLRAASLFGMDLEEVRNRVTITGGIEIGRLPGVSSNHFKSSFFNSGKARTLSARASVEIIYDEERMLPYLQSLINKYRVPIGFDEYISRPGRSKEKEMAVVRVCVITPREITSRKMMRA